MELISWLVSIAKSGILGIKDERLLFEPSLGLKTDNELAHKVLRDDLDDFGGEILGCEERVDREPKEGLGRLGRPRKNVPTSDLGIIVCLRDTAPLAIAISCLMPATQNAQH